MKECLFGYRSVLLSILLCGALSAQPTITFAQGNCAAGPKCSAAGAKLKAYASNAQSRLRGPFAAAGAAAAVYCVDMVTAEVSRVCGDEMKAHGESECASLAYRQSAASVNAAKGAMASSTALSTGPWRSNCGF